MDLARPSVFLHGDIPAHDHFTADSVSMVIDRDLGVALVTPTGSPGVADEPVSKVIVHVYAVANDDDCVVQFTVFEASGIVDSTVHVVLPVLGISCDSNDDGTILERFPVGVRISFVLENAEVGLTDRVVFCSRYKSPASLLNTFVRISFGERGPVPVRNQPIFYNL